MARNEKRSFIGELCEGTGRSAEGRELTERAGLVEAFEVATKHALRGEEAIFYEDLDGLLSWLPQNE